MKGERKRARLGGGAVLSNGAHRFNNTAHSNQQVDDSFTSFTSRVNGEVNKIIDRRLRLTPFLFTSFTSLQLEGGTVVRNRARPRPHTNLSPQLGTGERGEQAPRIEGRRGGNPVHFAVHVRVNERVSFTSAGEREVIR